MAHILIVDDEPDIRDSLAEIIALRFPEAELVLARDGPDGLAKIEQQRPDVIISDFRMPSMDGLAFLSKVREQHGEIPAILLTAFDERQAAQDAARTGIIRRFYMKPPEVDHIMAGLAELLDPESLAIE